LPGDLRNAAVVGIVRVALERPYTFVVAAILALLVGTVAGIRTPKDIFPNIGIPVISVVWSYSGLPPDDMSGRIVYIFERGLTTTVNDIEHIESQSVPGYGIVKFISNPASTLRRQRPRSLQSRRRSSNNCRPGRRLPCSWSSMRRACRFCSSRCRVLRLLRPN
jgi:hypothetical protein